MFDIFKKDTQGQPKDVKYVRDSLLQFIKEQLRKAEGGEGSNIKGLQIYIASPPEEKHMYEAAVFFGEEDRFKNEEVQRIADDYAIDLPEQWMMDIRFVERLPDDAMKVPGIDAALFISTRKTSAQKTVTAYIKVRMGEAEKEVYTISSGAGKICIGRGKKVQTADGFYRENDIAFPEKSENGANRFVSRQHAHIEFDPESECFLLFADDGGVPPRNKIKVRSANDANPIKLYSTKLGYTLKEGDQILLGDSALLEFSYLAGEKNISNG
ncbi:MAG TPA: FHA domain-containing protein [Flavisolibacter sp.]|nr:FHA domain-containing protein [Flavisolibacter sp.]